MREREEERAKRRHRAAKRGRAAAEFQCSHVGGKVKVGWKEGEGSVVVQDVGRAAKRCKASSGRGESWEG